MRERLGAWIKRLLPRYSWWPLAVCLAYNVLVYYIPRVIHVVFHSRYYDLSLPVDGKIPFVPAFVVFYVGAYVSWYLAYALVCREKPEGCQVVFADLIAKTICLVCFIALPTCLERPQITGGGLFNGVLRLIYAADTPADNLFPSIHCLESWIVWRGVMGTEQLSRGVKWGFFIMALLVFASTLLIKQHLIVDIPAGIAAAEAGLFIARRLRLGARYAARCQRLGVSA